jgi:hypothetical protein
MRTSITFAQPTACSRRRRKVISTMSGILSPSCRPDARRHCDVLRSNFRERHRRVGRLPFWVILSLKVLFKKKQRRPQAAQPAGYPRSPIGLFSCRPLSG